MIITSDSKIDLKLEYAFLKFKIDLSCNLSFLNTSKKLIQSYCFFSHTMTFEKYLRNILKTTNPNQNLSSTDMFVGVV